MHIHHSLQFFRIIRCYVNAVARSETLNNRRINCLMRSFSQCGGDRAWLVCHTTLSECRPFHRVPWLGFLLISSVLHVITLIVFRISLQSLAFLERLSWDPQTHLLSPPKKKCGGGDFNCIFNFLPFFLNNQLWAYLLCKLLRISFRNT